MEEALTIINLITAIAPAVTTLIKDVEGLFGPTASTAQKNQLVSGAVTAALQGSTSGATVVGATNVVNAINTLAPAIPSITNLFTKVAAGVESLFEKASTVQAPAPAVGNATTPAPAAVSQPSLSGVSLGAGV